ncbi:MAG: leucine-rich repeat domain-containing protein [Actinoplanes sp.]
MEADYRTDITATYQYTNLFGLNLPIELRRHPVEVAYIRLRSREVREGFAQAVSPLPQQGVEPRVDGAIGAIARHARRRNSGTRLIITGAAGSGKTTIAQWLAIRLSARAVPESLQMWRNCLPFVIPMRSLFLNRARPSYESMVGSSSSRGGLRAEWVREQLDRGTAVVIFDGFDELPEHDRIAASLWIDNLLRTHPRSHFIITSRPDNLDTGWLTRQAFRRLDLLPMSTVEARECINRWFDALLGASSPRTQLTYRRRRDQLLNHLEIRPAVRDLTETPLLCAMLCALYANSVTFDAPRTRIELYRKVVTALIDLRDRERMVEMGGNRMEYSEKKILLQAIARRMSDSSLSTIRIEPLRAVVELSQNNELGPLRKGGALYETVTSITALDIVTDELNGMVTQRLPAAEALQKLLQRSVVFQQVGNNEAQFVHRSIQEFLTGRAYAYHGDVDALLAKRDIAEWHRVIVFTAGAARHKDTATALISGILDLAEADDGRRRKLLLLAAECMGAAGQVRTELAVRARSLIREVLPPRSIDEARLLSGIDEETLAWLGYQPGMSVEVARACIWLASRTGLPASFALLADYGRSPLAAEVVPEVIDGWEWFDSIEFAEQVLDVIPLGNAILSIRRHAQARAVGSVRGARALRLEPSVDLADLTFAASLSELRDLDCAGSGSLRSLSGIEANLRLQRLRADGNKLLTDISVLGGLSSIRELYLTDCISITDFTPITRLAKLQVLVLNGCANLRDLSGLRELTHLKTLSINDCSPVDLAFCSAMPHLRTLHAKVEAGLESTAALADCSELRRVSLRLSVEDRMPVPALPPGVTAVELDGAVRPDDLASVAGLRDLQTFVSHHLPGVRSLAVFHDHRHLRLLRLPSAPDLEDASDLSRCTELEELDLSGSRIADLSVLSGLRKLRRVRLDRCHQITDISPLESLPGLTFLSLDGVPGVLNDAVTRLRELKPNAIIEHDPYPSLDEPVDTVAS